MKPEGWALQPHCYSFHNPVSFMKIGCWMTENVSSPFLKANTLEVTHCVLDDLTCSYLFACFMGRTLSSVQDRFIATVHDIGFMAAS